MPYATNADLPDAVRAAYSDRCQTVFRDAFNRTKGSESTAFAFAHTAAKNCEKATAGKAAWDAAFVNNLPDAAFAVVLPGGEKDDQGKTTPRDLRNLPHHKPDGSVDLPHLRNALARLPQSDLPADAERRAREHLEAHAKEAGVGDTAAKFVKGRRDMIEGLAIPFGGPIAGKDLDGEDFGPDTDFCLDWFPTGRPAIYHHGKDAAMKTGIVGRQTEYEVTDAGLWARVQLDTAHRYHSAIAELIDDGALGFSSGSVPHLVETTKDGHITRWPWIELSLTPTPANPAATVYAVKTTDLVDRLAAIEGAVPAPLVAEALKALDANRTDDPDALPDGASFTDTLDRLLVVASGQAQARKDWRAKSGRVLSAATRERLAGHPEQLRQLASDIEELLSTADAGKAALVELARFTEIEARLNGVPV